MRFSARTLASSAVVSVLLLVVFAALPDTAFANADFDTSTPAANSVNKAAPTQVVINFKQNVSPNGFNVVVYNVGGTAISDKPVIDPANPHRVTVNMTGDSSEIYRVDWQTVSAEDGKATLGAFTFMVSKTGGTSSGSSGTTVKSTTSQSSSNVVPILAAIIGLIVGSAGTYYATRNSQ